VKQHQYEKLTNFIKKPKAVKWIPFSEKHPSENLRDEYMERMMKFESWLNNA